MFVIFMQKLEISNEMLFIIVATMIAAGVSIMIESVIDCLRKNDKPDKLKDRTKLWK